MVDEREDEGVVPIVILAMPRSGSSMTAGLFQRHGVWFGECRTGDENNRKGYFENIEIKKAMVRRWGKRTLVRNRAEFERDPECDFQPGFIGEVAAILRRQGYTGGPWGYKCSALYKKAFRKAKFIGVRRQRVFEASRDQLMFGTSNPEWVQRMVDLHHAIIDTCPVVVKTDELIDGEYRTLERAFNYCGLTMNEKIVSDFVEPSLWHYKTSPTTTT